MERFLELRPILHQGLFPWSPAGGCKPLSTPFWNAFRAVTAWFPPNQNPGAAIVNCFFCKSSFYRKIRSSCTDKSNYNLKIQVTQCSKISHRKRNEQSFNWRSIRIIKDFLRFEYYFLSQNISLTLWRLSLGEDYEERVTINMCQLESGLKMVMHICFNTYSNASTFSLLNYFPRSSWFWKYLR